MNPRDFCREKGFTSALILTWSFDADFFEEVVLHDLSAGGTGEIVVVVDSRQVAEAIERWGDRLLHLGRRYLLVPAEGLGAFHPKLMIRLGANGGSAWLGSGNVSSGGWGGNRELATQWSIGPDQVDSGAWLRSLLFQAESWCGSALAREAVGRMREVSWLAAAEPTSSASVLVSGGHTTLAEQLRDRWAGRRFESVQILTGSTDSHGAFLAWAQQTFGVESAAVAVHPALASFELAQIARLPLRLEFIDPVADTRMLHAKAYWFDGPDGPAAVFGSANCSATASPFEGLTLSG
jgi:hypothetical protein